MAVGINPDRSTAPLPQGMLQQQNYRAAQLWSRWLQGFTAGSTLIGFALGSTRNPQYWLSSKHTKLNSGGTSTSTVIQIMNGNGSTVARNAWFRTWLASSRSTSLCFPEQGAASVKPLKGAVLDQVQDSTSQWYLRTSTTGQFRGKFTPQNSTGPSVFYLWGAVYNGKPWFLGSIGFSVTTTSAPDFPGVYLYISAGTEAANTIPFHLEMRKSSDNTRYQKPAMVWVGFSQFNYYVFTAGAIGGLGWSGGISVLYTMSTLRRYIVALHSSQNNIVKWTFTGTGKRFLHAGQWQGKHYVQSATFA